VGAGRSTAPRTSSKSSPPSKTQEHRLQNLVMHGYSRLAGSLEAEKVKWNFWALFRRGFPTARMPDTKAQGSTVPLSRRLVEPIPCMHAAGSIPRGER
jgi:hypothetical protein